MTVYDIITNKIIDALKGGEIPWRKPWKGGTLGYPRNWNGIPYRGINAESIGDTIYVIGTLKSASHAFGLFE